MSSYPGFKLPPLTPPKRRVFVSYHHDRDQYWFDEFDRLFCGKIDSLTNRSLEEPVDSDQMSYVHRAIREKNITGTSITIVLCGSETWKRKCLDWEIGSTLNMGHALLGIGLPTVAKNLDSSAHAPDRLLVNYQKGYAPWLTCPVAPDQLVTVIEDAISRSKTYVDDNSQPFMTRNRP